MDEKKALFLNSHGERIEPILKARTSRPAEGLGAGFADGLVYPPLPLSQILSLTYSNAFHTQCIALKADMAVGLEYEAPKPVETFLESVSGTEPFLELLHRVAFDSLISRSSLKVIVFVIVSSDIIIFFYSAAAGNAVDSSQLC